jgi:hypothetical protein
MNSGRVPEHLAGMRACARLRTRSIVDVSHRHLAARPRLAARHFSSGAV